jgi:acetyl esterase/lipase
VGAQERAVHGQVLVYPATDPALSSRSAHEFTDGPFLTRRDMEWFYDQYLHAPADREHAWALLRLATSTVPAVARSNPATTIIEAILVFMCSSRRMDETAAQTHTRNLFAADFSLHRTRTVATRCGRRL